MPSGNDTGISLVLGLGLARNKPLYRLVHRRLAPPASHPSPFESSMANSPLSTKETKEKKKRGNRGDFHGQRLEFLEANLPNYQRVSKEGKVRPWFNDVLFPEYWAKFHWSLPLEKEPSPSDVYPGNDSLTKAQEDAKETTMKAMGTVG